MRNMRLESRRGYRNAIGRLGTLAGIFAIVALSVLPGFVKPTSAAVGDITTVAGSPIGDGGPATSADLADPRGVAVDAAGNLFIADRAHHRVRKVAAATGFITTVAGTGTGGFSGDGGLATSASLNGPEGVALDAGGDLLIADTGNHRVRKVAAATGVITSVAGTGIAGFSGDGGAATIANLNSPRAVAVDAAGNLFIADSVNQRVRMVAAATGVITTVAGTGAAGFSGDGGPATSTNLNLPHGVAVDAAGNLFIADRDNHRIRRIAAATGVITTVAGTGAQNFSGDEGPATNAGLAFPFGVAVDDAGNLFIAHPHWIRRVAAASGVITTVAGTGAPGFSGDGGLATSTSLNAPRSVTFDAAGNLFIADTDNHRVRQVAAATRVITTVAGRGIGDGGAATSASLASPVGVAVDAAGNLFIADRDHHRIRKVAATTGVITTVAGTGTPGSSGDGGAATSANLNSPRDVAVDAAGNLFIADLGNQRVRKVAATGVITTVAGTGAAGFSGDGGPATSANLNLPFNVAVDAAGNLFIADRDNHRIRKVAAATGVITTVAGTGIPGSSGDGGPATSASLNSPRGVAVDVAGNLFIVDRGNHRVRKVAAATGVITTVAGTGTRGFSGDGGAATSANLNGPTGVVVDAAGNLFIADQGNHRVRKVAAAPPGGITTVAGIDTAGFAGDGGPATSANLNSPTGVALDAAGNLFIGDRDNHRIRKVEGVPTTDGAVPADTALAPLIATGHLVLVSSFNYDTALYEAFVPNLPGNPLTEIRPISVIFITLTQAHTVVVSGNSFAIRANTPTPVPVGANVTITVQ